MQGLKSIKEVKDLKGKRVLLRLDLNVPIIDDKIVNAFRIKKSLPTINFLRNEGAKTIIICHLWGEGPKSLKLIYEYLSKKISLTFAEDCVGPDVKELVQSMSNGEVVLLENLRMHEGEKDNDINFAEALAQLGDIYVNDAFSNSHRTHASMVSLPKLLPAYFGLLFGDEVRHLSIVLDPPRPFLFILGGAKFETKIPLIIKYLDKADYVYVAGALANDFFKVQGYETGLSKTSGKDYDLEKYLKKKNLILPRDVTVQNEEGIFVKKPSEVLPNDQIYDIGIESIVDLKDLIDKSEFILWNGPLGDYEKGFRDGTIDLVKAIAVAHAQSVIGGGDTYAVISKLDLANEVGFISTAGGALLEFLYSGTLVGIEALKAK